MKNRLLSITLTLLLAATAAQAQHFEWAKGFGTSDDAVVKGTVTDSLGNLYFLGQVDYSSTWRGESESILPENTPATIPAVVVAKVSPQGDMVWKKLVFNSKTASIAQDIKPLGDTGFAVMFLCQSSSYYPDFPTFGSSIYWMDTMYRTEYYPLSPYRYADRRFEEGLLNAYVAFDFDGNVTEQHFLQLSYVDTNGNDIMRMLYTNPDSLLWHRMSHIWTLSFDVDAEGNIYICRQAVDYSRDNNRDYRASQGEISAIKYWVDHRLAGFSPIENNPRDWYPQLLKFSPHFDTLLASRYVVQESDSANYATWLQVKVDIDDYVYIITHLERQGQGISLGDTIAIDTSVGVYYTCSNLNSEISYLTIFDNYLSTLGIVSLSDSVIDTGPGSNLIFHGISFDYDCNLFFLTAYTARGFYGDTIHFYSVLQYNGESLQLKNDAFFMAFERGTYPPVLHSYGRVPAKIESIAITNNANSDGANIACANNRLFMQAKYLGGIHLPNRYINYPNISNMGLGCVVFDYQGNVIDVIDYNAIGLRNRPEALALRDSTLYLISRLESEATFGDIHVYPDGIYRCFAKYVDTAFMTVYVPPAPSVGVEPPSETAVSVSPNPARDMLRIDLGGGSIAAATATSMLGQSTALRAKGDIVDLSVLPPGVYILEITAENGARHTAKVLKQ